MNLSPLNAIRAVARRVNDSYAYRSGPIYRSIVQTLPAPHPPAKPRFDLPLLTACGQKHLPMLVQSLYSLAICWSRLPAVTVVSDGTATVEEIEAALRWWPGDLQVRTWQFYADYHRARGRAAMAKYAEMDGFGRKLSAILAESEQRRMFWCDCDILFYSDFIPFLDIELPPVPFLVASLDWVHGYDTQLTDKLQAHLANYPPVNTGVDIFEGNLYDTCELEPLVEQATKYCNVFTEQTILAEAVYRRGKIVWDLDVMLIFDDDRLTFKPTFLGKHWAARHYVTPIRHLFWRDALAFRLGFRAGSK